MGIIKTAMMSGAAMYGVKQIANATEARRSNSPNNNHPAMTDSEHQEYLRWKSNQQQSIQTRGWNQGENQGNHGYYQQSRGNPYYLEENMTAPPMFKDYQNNNRGQYQDQQSFDQPPQYRSRNTQIPSGFIESNEAEEHGSRSRSRSPNFNAMIDQGLQTLQSSGGKQGDFLKKFVK